MKSFFPNTYVNGTSVGSQKNWDILTKEPYTIYMAFKKLFYYLYDAKNYMYDAKVIIKCDHESL